MQSIESDDSDIEIISQKDWDNKHKKKKSSSNKQHVKQSHVAKFNNNNYNIKHMEASSNINSNTDKCSQQYNNFMRNELRIFYIV